MAKSRHRATPARNCPVINGQPLTAAQERIWRLANDDLASSDAARQRRGMERLRGLGAELVARQAEVELAAGLAETAALERARGERVEAPKRSGGAGPLRVSTRDGLETLARCGAIDAVQLRAGMLYRQLYESADPERDLRSRMGELGGVGGGGAADREAWQEIRLRRSATLAMIEAKVRAADRGGRALRALREVAGHARCVSHCASGGGAQSALRQALAAALETAAEHFGLRRGG